MALTRAALTATLAGELADVLALASLEAADTTGALKEPLDRTFRALGVAEGGLAEAAAPDGAEPRAIAFATYFALARAASALAGRVDVATGRNETSAKESQAFTHVQALLEQARADAEGYGLPVGTGAIVPVPFAGGIARGDYAAVAGDPDRLPPLFGVGDPTPAGWDEPWSR